MMNPRRGGWKRRWPLWLLTGGLAVVAATGLLRSLHTDDLVSVARNLRLGDLPNDRKPDPVAALDVLERLLADEPDNVPALIEMARSWQDLRAWKNAIDTLQRACDASTEVKDKIFAKTTAMNLLAAADEYDKAVVVGEEIVALQPDEPLHVLHLGPIYLKGSQSAQERVLRRLMDRAERRLQDLAVEKRVEAFVTDLWGEPDAAALVAELTPGADSVFRQGITDDLLAARKRFGLADATLGGYRDWGGSDLVVARSWCQVLLRTGRLFDAHVESGMALREPNLALVLRRDFLDMQAQCAIAVGDWAQAAGKLAEILVAYAGDPAAPPPFSTLWAVYEARTHAGQWDWILEHVAQDTERWGDDPVLRWARAAALYGTDRAVEAREALNEPFASVRLGTRAFSPPSLRLFPTRRRDIALLAYHVFTATGDTRSSDALDAILAMDPTDAEALRLRAEQNLAAARYEAATADAFALLVPERRDRADFERWRDAADTFAVQRTGSPLAELARGRVRSSQTYMRASDEAMFQQYKVLGLKAPKGRSSLLVDQLYVEDQPELTLAIVDELVAGNSVELARSELRKLTDAYPQVQEFRFRLGKLLVREGQFELAAAEFDKLLADIPGDTEVLDLAMRTRLALAQPQEAAELVTRTILQDPLGAGAVRYGHRLLERGRADEAAKLVERILRWTDFDGRLDVLVLAARADLSRGKLEEAEGFVASLGTSYPDSYDVALLGLDVGLARGKEGLVQAAVDALRPVAPGLFPDQLAEVARKLLEAGLDTELLSIFDETVCALPAARLALRDVAQAHKALGDPARADELLARLEDDRDAVLDRFLLQCLQGQPDGAARQLRLQPATALLVRERSELCLLACNALMDLQALMDGEPLSKLNELNAQESFGPAQLELLDALLRLLPQVTRLDGVLPRAVVEDPRSIYPAAGADVEALVDLASSDPDGARQVATDLLYLILMQDRPFWADESRQLALHALTELPGLQAPTRSLARRDLFDGRPREALQLLQPLLVTDTPDLEDLRLFLQASRDFEHAEWGVALALFFEDRPDAVLELADALAEWGHAEQARPLYEQVLAARPGDAAAQAGLVRVLQDLHLGDTMVAAAEQALTDHPDDEDLAATCADALASLSKPNPKALSLMQFLWSRHEDFDQLGEAVARAAGDDEPLLTATLSLLAERAAARPADEDTERSSARGQALVRAARTARAHGLLELAHRLNELALRMEPGAVLLYRELAFLELEMGHLETARSYLEVLSFVDLDDRDAAMELARLDFRRLGQPVRAANVVRRTFSNMVPPDMVEILAAEAWLLGRPEEAITDFVKVSYSPLISADTYTTVMRIAWASGEDEVARLTANLVLQNTSEGDPRRARAEWLLSRLPKPAPQKPTAAG